MPSLPSLTNLRRRDVTFLAAALFVLGGVWGVPRSVAAGSEVQLEARGPAVLTAASTYTIMGDGETARICRVQETATRQSDSKAPFAFPVSLSDLPTGSQTLTFQAVGCDNTLLGQVKVPVEVPVHVVSTTPYVAPAAEDQALRSFTLSVSAGEAPVSAVITRGGSTLASLGTVQDDDASWTWAPGSAPAGAYRAEVTAGGHTVVVPFTITSHWAPLGKPFPRCQVLTWSYDAAGQPARASGMATDIGAAFTRISKATGIRFAKVRTGTIRLGWDDLGASGPDGEGGSSWSGSAAISGKVTFNTRSSWVGKAGFKRYPGDFPGRGALITHEIGHALGLGHVTDRAQVMYPVASNGSPLGLAAGDRAGLNALYHARSC